MTAKQCKANQGTGFYMTATLAFDELMDLDFLLRSGQNWKKFKDHNSGEEHGSYTNDIIFHLLFPL